MDNKHNDIIKTTLDSIKGIVESNTVIGEPVNTPGGITIIPVSKVSLGFASGGLDYASKKEEAAKYFYEYIEKHHTEKLLPFDGAKDVLEYCKNSGKLIYLITNKSKQYIHDEIKILGFEKYFKKVVAAKEYEYDKPHPIACQAIFDYKLPPAEEIIVIGDGDADVKTAEALGGADSIICDTKDKYVGSKPTYKIKNIAEAIKILEK